MMKKTVLIFLSFCFIVSLYGQGEDSEIFYFDKNSPPIENVTRHLVLIKTNPVSAFWGKQFVEVETPINNFISLQAAIGVTFRAYIKNNTSVDVSDIDFLDVYCPSPNWPTGYDYCDQYDNNDIRNSALGFYSSAAIKIFPALLAPRRLHFSIHGEYINRRNEVANAVEGMKVVMFSSDDYTEETINHLNITLRCGYQNYIGPVSTEIFLGTGLNHISSERPDIGFNADRLVQNSTRSIIRNDYILVSGLRVGLGFSREKKKAARTTRPKKSNKRKRNRKSRR